MNGRESNLQKFDTSDIYLRCSEAAAGQSPARVGGDWPDTSSFRTTAPELPSVFLKRLWLLYAK